MKEAGPSVLAWAIEGAVNFARNGYQLQTPDVVEEVTEQYRGQEDWVGNFIAECCTTAADARTGAAELYQAYRGMGGAQRRLCPAATRLQRSYGGGRIPESCTQEPKNMGGPEFIHHPNL